ncbi:MAG: efflux transporter periplasmic adaptor subunit, partial [Flavobacteriales bacterium]
MKRVIIIIVVVVVALGAIAYVLNNNKKKAEETTAFIAKGSGAVAVKTASVERKEINLDFTVNG